MSRSPSPSIIAAPAEHAPDLTVDAVVIEDDTYLVLGSEPVARRASESPQRLLERAAVAQPATPGSVVVRRGTPLRLHAVVHDLSLDPSWREAWVAEALGAVFQEVEVRRLRALSLPPLGSQHGTLSLGRFARLLAASLRRQSPGHLEAVWLVLPAQTSGDELAALRELGLVIRP